MLMRMLSSVLFDPPPAMAASKEDLLTLEGSPCGSRDGLSMLPTRNTALPPGSHRRYSVAIVLISWVSVRKPAMAVGSPLLRL